MKANNTFLNHTILCTGLMVVFVSGINAMNEQAYEGNTYKGELIATDTIADLAQRHTPLPKNIQNKLNKWLQTEVVVSDKTTIQECFSEEDADELVLKNQDLIEYLTQLPDDLSTLRAKSECNKKVMQIIGQSHPVYPRLNYIFEPTDGVVLRIASIVNRFYNIISGQEGEKWLDPYGEKGQMFIKNPEMRKDLIIMPTYQTISMYTNYLLLKKFIAEHNLTHIITPDTYLMHIPDKPAEVSDDNYMLIQNKVEGELVDLAKNPCAWETLSDQAIKDLFVAARVGLWNITGNLLVDNNGNCVLLDLEQPNNSDPRAFFNKPMTQEWNSIRGRGGYARYVVDGIEGIALMMQKAQEQCPGVTKQLALWKALIQQNNNLLQHLNQSQQDRLDKLGND